MSTGKVPAVGAGTKLDRDGTKLDWQDGPKLDFCPDGAFAVDGRDLEGKFAGIARRIRSAGGHPERGRRCQSCPCLRAAADLPVRRGLHGLTEAHWPQRQTPGVRGLAPEGTSQRACLASDPWRLTPLNRCPVLNRRRHGKDSFPHLFITQTPFRRQEANTGFFRKRCRSVPPAPSVERAVAVGARQSKIG